MLLPPLSVRVRALAPVFVALAISGALFLPRPGSDTAAVPASTSAPFPQEALTPLVFEMPRATPGFTTPAASPIAPPSRNLDAGVTRRVESSPAVTSEPGPAAAAPLAAGLPGARQPPRGPTHVVVPGDDLWTIARCHSAAVAAILRWNKDVDPNRLVAGQRILVPGGTRMQAARLPARPRPTPPSPSARSGAPNLTPPRITAPSRPAGSHVWPLSVRGTITTRYSAAHLGIDISAPFGSQVRAVAAGIVTWAGWKNNGGGNVVVVRHRDGMVSTYNHMSTLLVRIGDTVAAGEPIARVGSTGWSTGPHVDVRIEMGGRPVDPLGVL